MLVARTNFGLWGSLGVLKKVKRKKSKWSLTVVYLLYFNGSRFINTNKRLQCGQFVNEMMIQLLKVQFNNAFKRFIQSDTHYLYINIHK